MSEPKIKCTHCGDKVDRLLRNGSGESWVCAPCYIGFNCFPTPQTKWSTDNAKHIGEEGHCPKCGCSSSECTTNAHYQFICKDCGEEFETLDT